MRKDNEDHTKYRSEGRKYQMDKKGNIKISNGEETKGGEETKRKRQKSRVKVNVF